MTKMHKKLLAKKKRSKEEKEGMGECLWCDVCIAQGCWAYLKSPWLFLLGSEGV